MSSQSGSSGFTLSVENIGGIDATYIEFSEGVNVLSGENATNRTSLLQAIAAALGSEHVSLKGDASHGRVELSYNGETYVREITDSDGTPKLSGEPMITGSDADLAEKFAFLFEQNEARRAIEQGGNLREVVMEPIDTAEIDRKISNLTEERTHLRNELSEINALRDEVRQLQNRRDAIESEIAETTERLTENKEEIEESDADVGKSREQKSEAEEKLELLQNKQRELERVRDDIDSTEDVLESLQSERNEHEEALAECVEATGSLEQIEDQIDTLHDQLAQKESLVSEVQNLIQFNKDMIENNVVNEDVFAALRVGAENRSDSVTSQLLQDSEEIVCWTCGNSTNRERISETVTRLQDVHEDLYGERVQLQNRISELEEERSRLAEAEQRKDDLEQQIRSIEEKIDQNEQRLERLEKREDELTDAIDSLEEEIRELRENQEERVLELHQQVNQLEYELEELRSERDSIEEKLDTYRERIERVEDIESEIENINETLENLRQRVESLERQTIEEFNHHMESVLEILEYDNIERIWLERRDVEAREGRRKVQKTVFDIHVVRQAADGTTYEDSLGHLSESEREVTGLVFALAGNLAHEVYESVPFLLLDSLEAIDSNRIAVLIDYFSDIVDNIIVALLSEDADAVSVTHEQITNI